MKCVSCGQNEGDFGPMARRCDFCGAGRKAQAELIALIDRKGIVRMGTEHAYQDRAREAAMALAEELAS
jgi:hypothetical protein